MTATRAALPETDPLRILVFRRQAEAQQQAREFRLARLIRPRRASR